MRFGKSWGTGHGYSILGWARHRPGELRERKNDLSTKKAKKGEHDWRWRVFQKDFCSDLDIPKKIPIYQWRFQWENILITGGSSSYPWWPEGTQLQVHKTMAIKSPICEWFIPPISTHNKNGKLGYGLALMWQKLWTSHCWVFYHVLPHGSSTISA